MSFRLTPNYADKLKPAIEALCYTDFNPQGLAMVKANEDGIHFMLRNAETNTVANLYLKASGLMFFHCSKPIDKRTIDLQQFLDILNSGHFYDKENFLTVEHDDEFSTSLKFIPELRKSYDNVIDEMFPEIKYACQIVLESKILKEMVDGVINENEEKKLVSVYVGKRQLTIKLQLETPLEYKCDNKDKDFIDSEEGYHGWFELRYLMSLKKALTLANFFELCLLDEPSEYVMIQLHFEGFGNLIFVQKALLITKDPVLASLLDGATTAEEIVSITSEYGQH
ncbi:Caprin-2 [Bienertia sinuspersici]